MSFPLPREDGTCLITGCSAGIGVGIARELARRGYNLTIVARREDRLQELAAELEGDFQVQVTPIACDICDAAARQSLFKQIAANGNEIDVLVNNAGLGGAGAFVNLDFDRAMQMIDTNITALVALTHPVVSEMVERGSGAIMNVASTAAFQPIPREAVYSSTKAFVLSFGEALHTELKGTGVTCTTLCPGPTDTEFAGVAGVQKLFDSAPKFTVASADDVAIAGVDAMVHGRRTVVYGKLNRVGALAGQITPRSLTLLTMDKMWPMPKEYNADK